MTGAIISTLATILLAVSPTPQSVVAPEVCERQGPVERVAVAEDFSAYAVTCRSGIIRLVAIQ